MNIVCQPYEQQILLFTIKIPVLESFVHPYHEPSAWAISTEGRDNTCHIYMCVCVTGTKLG